MTPTPILHRTHGSPYADKAMLMLNYAELDWQSIIAPKGVPRPIQELLVGNYSRRIPILQMGADLYCDTAMIMEAIAELSLRPELSLQGQCEETSNFVTRIETEGSLSMLAVLTPWNFISGYFRNIPLRDAWAFLADRKRLAGQYPEMVNKEAREANAAKAPGYLEALEARLLDSKFMSGVDTPNCIDFAAFTMIHYHQMLTGLKLAKQHKRLLSWYQNMLAFSLHVPKELNPEFALNTASQCQPLAVPDTMLSSPRIGEPLSFKVNDALGVITEPVSGTLVGEDHQRIILRREHPRIGRVHLHFPKQCLGACG